MSRLFTIVAVGIIAFSCSQKEPSFPKHVDVYYEEGRFGGWPANYGIWSWDNEILLGFSRGYYKDLGEERHNIDREKPEESLLARSLDGGETWSIEDPSGGGVFLARSIGDSGLHGVEPEYDNKKEPRQLTEPVDFSHPDLAMMFRFLNHNTGPSLFYYSYDRGREWHGPFHLVVSGRDDILARTDYITLDEKKCMVFLSVSKEDHREGRPICAFTDDGGITWELKSYIGPEPQGFGIMPSTVQLSDNEFLTTVRRREGPKRWIDAWRSVDAGNSWSLEDPPVKDLGEGNPPSLLQLKDGRLCLTYGVRAVPFRIAAKISGDGGKTWSDEIVLRDDGAGRDLGYVRSIQRLDGKIVTAYYFQDKLKPERYIGATIWQP